MPLLEVRHLRKSFGATLAVSNLSFSLEEGEVLGLVGANGAGKTTTLLMIAGLLEADRGEVLLEGTPLGPAATTERRHLGWVPQDLALYSELTARENLLFFGKLYGLQGEKLEREADRVLQICNLGLEADRSAGTLSGGTKRKLNLAIGLIHRPRLLLLDEATVGLDLRTRRDLFGHLRRIADQGTSIIYSSQYLPEVERICDEIAILEEGRLLLRGTPESLRQGKRGTLAFGIAGDSAALTTSLEGMGEVVERAGGGLRLEVPLPHDDRMADFTRTLGRILAILEEHQAVIERIWTAEAGLEETLLSLVNHELEQ